jgi:uncharacterized membrane protein
VSGNDETATGNDHARLAAMMIGSAVLHMVVPQVYESVVPPRFRDPRRVVHVSGLAELACGVLLLVPRTRRVGGLATAGLLVGVFPANVQMALDAGTERQAIRKMPAGAYRAVALARLPLQVPLVLRALKVARRG